MSKEFYSVIIDISAFKKSIISYRQYLVYKNTIVDNININTMASPVYWPPISHPYLYIIIGVADN